MTKIKLSNVTKKYEESSKLAVNDFNLEIEDKEFIVIVGPSGCGKSTLLRMIAGLEKISSGKLFIDGKDVTNLHPKDRDIAMVFQSYALYPHLSVFDNLAFPLKVRKIAKDEIKKKVLEISSVLGLEDYLSKKPKELSGGQRQRVAIGRAMIKGSSVFLLDEPLSNLDAKLRNQMRFELKDLSKKLDATFIYVTHDQVEAMTLGDRIVVMNEGRIAQVGSPVEIFNKPNSIFVASFIGSPAMNFIDAQIFSKEGKTYARVFDKEIQLSNSYSYTEQELIFGIRPKDISLSADGIKAKLIYGEMLGGEAILHLDVKGKQILCLKECDGDNTHSYKQGDTLYIDFLEKNIHIFDKETGRAI